jgi:glycosyltransferase involved in cell wall biosynthesis
MHCGKPVVATRLGTGVEYVTIDGSTGSLVAPNNPIELATALRTLLADADMRQRFGEAGKRRVQEVFSVDQMVSKTIDVYRRVLNGVAK